MKHTLETNLFEYSGIEVIFAAENAAILFPYALSEAEQEKAAEKIYALIKNAYKKEAAVCICEKADRMDQLAGLYEKAVKIYELAEKAGPHRVFRQADYEMEYLFLKESRTEMKEYEEKIFGDLEEEEMLLTTLNTFFKENMSISKTAEKLYIHRNTLTFRLKRIRQITGLSPAVFHDAMKLYLALFSRKAGV